MFLETQYESYIEDIHDTFEAASKECEDTVSALDTLAWEYDELLTQIEDGEDYDVDRAERLVEQFQNRIERGASDAEGNGDVIDYYSCYEEIKVALVQELRDSGYGEFAEML